MTSEIAPHIWLPEPKLAFHPERASDQDTHPLRGLLRFGPYAAGLVPDPIRVATIAPFGESERLFAFMRALNIPSKPIERREYLPEWPGFHRVFGLHMRGAGRGCHIELDAQLDSDMKASAAPHAVLADRLLRAVQSLDARRSELDVLFIYIPQHWAPGFTGGSADDFDLHDHMKAATAARRLPVQLLREDKALAYRDQASVMWRIGLALYVKAGGIPWKLAEADNENAYIGLSYAVRPRRFRPPTFRHLLQPSV